jgi:hypothetical protein
MRSLLIAIFAAVVAGFTPKPVIAQDVKPLDAAASAKIKSEVLDAVASYLNIWNAHDAKSIAENVYAVPSFVVPPNGVVVPSLHTEDIAKMYGNVMKQEKARGWDRSTTDVASVCVLNANTALAGGKSTRYRTDGSVLSVLAETLIYVRTKAGWRIAGLIVQQPNKVVTCNE